jgi:AhpD family alkylhydroperoxidase
MAISVKEKELIAVAISVATGCKPCTDYHVKAVRKAGASDDEIRQAVADALSVRQSATSIMERYALAHLGESGQPGIANRAGQTHRLKELVSIGAAFGVNCVASLEQHLATAATVGISQEDLAKVARLAAFIKKRAASHVERLVGMAEEAAA